jgi:AAA domain
MAISLASLNRTTALKPPRLLIHGVHGVGKTTFAAGAPDRVFLLTEDGLGTLDVPHFPLARTFDEVMQALAALYTEEHTFRTRLSTASTGWSPWSTPRSARTRAGAQSRTPATVRATSTPSTSGASTSRG